MIVYAEENGSLCASLWLIPTLDFTKFLSLKPYLKRCVIKYLQKGYFGFRCF